MRDLDHLAAIHAASFTHPRPWTASELAEMLNVSGTYILEESQGFVMGRVILDEVELLTIAVDPAARRLGIGARLLEAFQAAAMGRGATSAFLEVAAGNLAAQGLYLSRGWKISGRRKSYYRTENGQGEDALIMSLSLT